MTTQQWWSLRGEERAKAKAEFEAAHPLSSGGASRGPRGGFYKSRSGRYFFFGGRLTAKVAKAAATADIECLPDWPIVEVDGQPAWLTDKGMHRIDLNDLPRSIADALRAETPIPAGSSGEAAARAEHPGPALGAEHPEATVE